MASSIIRRCSSLAITTSHRLFRTNSAKMVNIKLLGPNDNDPVPPDAVYIRTMSFNDYPRAYACILRLPPHGELHKADCVRLSDEFFSKIKSEAGVADSYSDDSDEGSD
ncbi:hypothetical protein FRX31_023133 [Thalictrum thalictroides]|uniref:Uncharacterized protein n=1 Tax=Thalictrum thalictroides TaxID=46969 RepID=A0A7J6VSX0_THATH|nr:hypothetical protein FRX31_023133 [Thalictrum thalictroides]